MTYMPNGVEPIVTVRVRAPVISFRRPLDHNYQRTLPMPPPTTLLGIAGAALGLTDRELWTPDSLPSKLKVSVWIEEEPGRARDMWTVLKIKSGKIAERSPYFRELLFFGRYTLLYGGEASLLHRLEKAFLDPAYPLSLGREDELALVEKVTLGAASKGEPRFRGTILPGDIRQVLELRPLLREGAVFGPLVVETLPLSFTIDAKGIRHPELPKPFSFLPLGIDIEMSGARHAGPLPLQFEDRNFVWLNVQS